MIYYIVFIIFTLSILFLVFYEWQHFMIFSPTHYRSGFLGEEYRRLVIMSDDGRELEGVVYSPKNVNLPQRILFFAGRSHDSVGLIERLAVLYPKIEIITFNYRGYGESKGRANEKNTLQDGLKIAKLVQKNYGDFHLLGYSLGSSIAAFVASELEVKTLFLVGAFDSIPSIARERFKFARLIRYSFDTGEFVKNVTAPTYLFASRDDETIYIQNTRKLKEKVKNLSYYEEFDELSHKEILWDKRVIKKIIEILA